MPYSWTEFAVSDYDPEQPVTTGLVGGIINNHYAQAEGASGAPQHQTAAYANLSVTGAKVADQTLDGSKIIASTAGDYIEHYGAEKTFSYTSSYSEAYRLTVPRDGVISTKMFLKSSLFSVYARIYVNGSPVGTERTTSSATYQEYDENITVEAGDLLQIYTKGSPSPANGAVYINIMTGNSVGSNWARHKDY